MTTRTTPIWLLAVLAYRPCESQITSQYFSLADQNDTLDPRVGERTAREVFHLGINHAGDPTEAAVLRAYLEEAIAQVRAKPRFAEVNTFGSVRELVSHIRELADAELRTVPSYREAEARRDAPTRDVVCERIRQETPANMVDGMWANTFAPTSVPTRWQLMVEKIRWEEQGEGVLEKNHAYNWQQLTRSIGLRFPPAEAAAFATHAELSDEAFVNPALATAFGHLHGYWPEKLGAIAYFETMSSPFSHRSAAQLRLYGIDPSWYVTHRSIDNAKNGHAATILDAIVEYVDSTAYGATTGAGARAHDGTARPREAELVSRVFVGFLLYELSFSLVDGAAARRLAEGSTCPDDDFEWMVGFVARFAGEASHFHKRNVTAAPAAVEVHAGGAARQAGGAPADLARAAPDPEALAHVRLGELMLSDPAAFVRHVGARCDLVDPRSPPQSKLLAYFSIDGPMYGVASADDLQRIERWIGSLARRGACA